MPYDRNSDLPKQTHNLTEHQKTIFRKAFNSSLKHYGSEETAFRVAWSAAKKEASMNKTAAVVTLVKLSRYMNNPIVPIETRRMVAGLAKEAGLFDSAMDFGSSALSGIGNMASTISSGIGSAIGAMLPPGITWEAVADKLKAGDPEMASLAMSSGVDFVEAVKQAVGQAGVSMDDILEGLGLK